MKGRDYNSFGMKLENSDYVNRDNKYLYYGKELIDQAGLDCYGYGARMYSAELGRWNSVVNYAADYHMMIPYTNIGNNPMNYYDLNRNRMHEYISGPRKESNYTEDGGAGGDSWNMIDSNGSPTWNVSDGSFKWSNVPENSNFPSYSYKWNQSLELSFRNFKSRNGNSKNIIQRWIQAHYKICIRHLNLKK